MAPGRPAGIARDVPRASCQQAGFETSLGAGILCCMGTPFVVHEHSGYGELHYDLMLSVGEALATWQLAASPPEMTEGDELPARRLDDHRLAYLDYEGPVSGGRGQVRRIEKGNYELVSRGPLRWEVLLDGEKLTGRGELVRPDEASETWTLRRLGPA